MCKSHPLFFTKYNERTVYVYLTYYKSNLEIGKMT